MLSVGIALLIHTNATAEVSPGEFVKTWLVLGPIPVSGDGADADTETQKNAFAEDFLGQHGGEAGIQPEVGLTHQIGGQEYEWQLVESETNIIDLIETYGEKEFVVAYAWAEFESSEAMSALLGLGSDDGAKIWVNGELVHENWIGRPVAEDDDIIPVDLKQGKNQLLLKVQNMQMGWGFACRVLDPANLEEQLYAAAGNGNLDSLEMLLTHGVDPNATGKHLLTPLQRATMRGRTEAAELLLKYGAKPDVPMPSKESLVDALFEEPTQGDRPGAAVLVAQNGEILYQKGFGFANLEHHVPITPETKFRIGSVSKQFTAAAILKLQEDGLLSVADPLSKYLPDYPRGNEVTIHHLLTHTSGIHSFTGREDFLKRVTTEVSHEEQVEWFKNDPYDFDPGEKWLYNNSGYFLLSYLVEKISGETFDDYLKHQFFEPLGMKDTGVHHWSLILEHEATGYAYQDGKMKKSLDWDMSQAGGAGSLYSTVGDLFRWNEAIFGGQALSEESLKAAFTPATLNDGSVADAFGGEYGYGWMMMEERGLKEIAHGGGLDGFQSYLTRYPERNLTVAVLANAAPAPPGLTAGGSANEIAEIYLWGQMEDQESFAVNAAIDTSIYDDYVGRYDYGRAVLTVTREGNRLFAQLSGQPRFEIFPKSETEFFWKVTDAQVIFVRNEEGNVTHVIHHQGGQENKALKLEDEEIAEVDPALYDAYVGDYDLKPMGTLSVTKEENRLFAQLTGQPKFEIFPRSATEFFPKVVNATIIFVKDEAGEVTKIILRQAGMTFEAPKIK